ncbi:MAG: hypothetical protein RIC55_31925 [Pirellulaceae bacterium]
MTNLMLSTGTANSATSSGEVRGSEESQLPPVRALYVILFFGGAAIVESLLLILDYVTTRYGFFSLEHSPACSIAAGVLVSAAAWGALGPGKALVRLPVSLALAVGNGMVMLLFEAALESFADFAERAWETIVLSMTAYFVAQLPFWAAAGLVGWQMVRTPTAISGDFKRPRVRVLHFLLAMTIIGLMLACFRQSKSFEHWYHHLRYLSPLFVLLSAAGIAMPMISSLLAPQISRSYAAIGMSLAAFFSFVLGGASLRPDLLNPIALPVTCLLGALTWRRTGYRVVGFGDVPDVDETEKS